MNWKWSRNAEHPGASGMFSWKNYSPQANPPSACFYVLSKLRVVFVFLKSCKTNKEYATETYVACMA